MSKQLKDQESYDSDILEPMATIPGQRRLFDDDIPAGTVEPDNRYQAPTVSQSDYTTRRTRRAKMVVDSDPAEEIPETIPATPPAPTRRVSRPAESRRRPSPAPAPTPAPAVNIDPEEEIEQSRRQKAEHREHRSRRFVQITDRRFAIFGGVLLIIIAAYLLLVTVSYFFQGGADQSILTNDTAIGHAFHGGHAEVKNVGGVVGAWLAEVLMSQWLGLGSFIVIFWLGAVGLSMVKVKPFKFWNLTLRCLLSAVVLSIVMGLVSVTLADKANTFIYPGGLHGHELNRLMVDLAGWWGALGVSLVLIALVAMLFYNDLRAAYLVYKRRMAVHKARRAERRAAREQELAEREAEREAERRERLEQQRRRDKERAERERRDEEQRQRSMMAAREARAGKADDDFDAEDDEPKSERPAAFAGSPDLLTPTEMVASLTNDEPPLRGRSPREIEDEEDNGPVDDNLADTESDIDDVDAADDSDTDNDNNTDTDNVNDNDGVEFTIERPDIEPGDPNLDNNAYDPTADLPNFRFPSIDLLIDREVKTNSIDASEEESNKARITKTLSDYGIPISSIKATVGPTVTLYEIVPAEGVKIAKIKRLEDDIALSLAALGIRIIAPIPGRGTIGIEVPNKDPQTVPIRAILSSKAYQETRCILPMAMGCTISNEVFIADLAKMPHLLVAGATGMGKSVGLNTIIASLLYKKHPSELKFVLIDPKMVEFSLYSKLERHYLAKMPGEEDAIITDVHKAVTTLNSLLVEMESRYKLLKDAKKARNIVEYNAQFVSRGLNPADGHRFLPYIVVVVDEFADLIMQVGREVETPIARLAQKARAVGIHVILATQRPSTDVITGVIKANFPGRIAFRVFQMVDSRTILDRPGANQLIGRGDMLFSTGGKVERIQCAFIDTPEVDAMCDAIERQAGYPCPYELPEFIPEESDGEGGSASAGPGDRDPLFEEIARFICNSSQASTSSLQRRYNIGYNRAGRIMDQLEAAGVVGPAQGGKPRQVLLDPMQIERLLGLADPND